MNDTHVTDTGPHTAQTRRAGVQAAESTGDHPRPVTSPTRISGTWAGIIVGALVLVLLLVFVLQNTKAVKVSFFTANGDIPLGVALIFAAIGGVLLAAVAASLRIIQIRRRLGGGRTPEAEPAMVADGGSAPSARPAVANDTQDSCDKAGDNPAREKNVS